MEDLLTQPDVRHLMLIGAYRDNEVDASHPLIRTLAAMRQAGAILQDIVLAPLNREDLAQLNCRFSSLRTGAVPPRWPQLIHKGMVLLAWDFVAIDTAAGPAHRESALAVERQPLDARPIALDDGQLRAGA